MESPGHRANILYPKFREAGMGVAFGDVGVGESGVTYALDFGSGGRRERPGFDSLVPGDDQGMEIPGTPLGPDAPEPSPPEGPDVPGAPVPSPDPRGPEPPQEDDD